MFTFLWHLLTFGRQLWRFLFCKIILRDFFLNKTSNPNILPCGKSWKSRKILFDDVNFDVFSKRHNVEGDVEKKYTHVFQIKYTPVLTYIPVFQTKYISLYFPEITPILQNTSLYFTLIFLKIHRCVFNTHNCILRNFKIHLVFFRKDSNCSKYIPVFYTFLKNKGSYFKKHPCVFNIRPCVLWNIHYLPQQSVIIYYIHLTKWH